MKQLLLNLKVAAFVALAVSTANVRGEYYDIDFEHVSKAINSVTDVEPIFRGQNLNFNKTQNGYLLSLSDFIDNPKEDRGSDKKETTISILQNALENELAIACFADSKGEGSVTLFNLKGDTIYRMLFDLAIGENNKSFNISVLPEGVYMLELKVNGQTTMKRIVIE